MLSGLLRMVVRPVAIERNPVRELPTFHGPAQAACGRPRDSADTAASSVILGRRSPPIGGAEHSNGPRRNQRVPDVIEVKGEADLVLGFAQRQSAVAENSGQGVRLGHSQDLP